MDIFLSIEEKKNKLRDLIDKYAQDGVLSPEEESEVFRLSSKYKIPETECRRMIKDALNNCVRTFVKTLLLDGKLTDDELESIKVKATACGIDDDSLMFIINEEKSLFENEKKQLRSKKAKKVGKQIIATAVSVAGVYLAKTIIDNKTASVVRENNNLKQDNNSLLGKFQSLSTELSNTRASSSKQPQVMANNPDKKVMVKFSFKIKKALGESRISRTVPMRLSDYKNLQRGTEKAKRNWIINHSPDFNLGFVGSINAETIDDVSVELAD